VSTGDVVARQWGRLPLKAGRERGRPDALADRYRVMDHGADGGTRGIISVEGVKFTTARRVAEVAVDRIVAILGAATAPCRTLEHVVDGPEGALDLAFETRIRRAIREEMAVRLSDVVLRRIPPVAGPGPDRERVTAAARIAATELGWTPAAQEAEIDDVLRRLPSAGRSAEPPA
jgi:glycerol-3-phosphate dehydrogenase